MTTTQELIARINKRATPPNYPQYEEESSKQLRAAWAEVAAELARLKFECDQFSNGSAIWQQRYVDAKDRAEHAEAMYDKLNIIAGKAKARVKELEAEVKRLQEAQDEK